MATRSLATRMWAPAASALRHRPGPGMPPPARSRFVETIHSQAEHRTTGIPKSAANDESLGEELYKIRMTLRERKAELDKIHAEMKSVAKRFVVAIVGLPLLACVLET